MSSISSSGCKRLHCNYSIVHDCLCLTCREANQLSAVAQEERVKQRALRRVVETVEPELMARHYMLPEDDQIRGLDLPEREQLTRGQDPQDSDLTACAK
jgi:hypothetical protein